MDYVEEDKKAQCGNPAFYSVCVINANSLPVDKEKKKIEGEKKDWSNGNGLSKHDRRFYLSKEINVAREGGGRQKDIRSSLDGLVESP